MRDLHERVQFIIYPKYSRDILIDCQMQDKKGKNHSKWHIYECKM